MIGEKISYSEKVANIISDKNIDPCLFCLSHFACPILPVPCWMSCSVCSILLVQFCLPCQAVLFYLSRSACPVIACPVLPDPFCMSRSAILYCLSCPGLSPQENWERKKPEARESESAKAKARNLRPKNEREDNPPGSAKTKKERTQLCDMAM
jgi:hypothetical protein